MTETQTIIGLRLPDTRDFLDGRPSRDLFDEIWQYEEFRPNLPAFNLEEIFGKPKVEEDALGSNWKETLIDVIFAILSTIFIRTLIPDLGFFWTICCVVIIYPMSLVHIWVRYNIAYTDRRGVAERNYNDTIISLSVYMGTLVIGSIPRSYFINLVNWTSITLGTLHFARQIVSDSWTRRLTSLSAVIMTSVFRFRSFMYTSILTGKAFFMKALSVPGILAGMVWNTSIVVLATHWKRPRKRFSYSQLQLNSCENCDNLNIRLLRLQRKWPFVGIQAKLEVHQLQSAPPYHAISYVWSRGPQDMRRMILNDMELEICGNVYDILKRCSSYFGPRFIWIDTICINQQDDREKAFQVRKMRDIYKKAGQVIVCLGVAPGIGASLYFLGKLNFIVKTWGNVYLNGYVYQLYQRKNFDKYLCDRIEGLIGLVTHPWFERVWIIQEMVAAQHIAIFYGDHYISWPTLHDNLVRIIATESIQGMLAAFCSVQPTSASDMLSPFRNLNNVPSLTKYRFGYQWFEPDSICGVLRKFRSWKATDRIDKIFAVIGLAKPEKHGEFLAQLINYTRSQEEIILSLANHLVDTAKYLEILDLAGIGWDHFHPNLPSWVVDWRSANFQISISESKGNLKISLNQSKPYEYRSAAGKASVVKRGRNDRELVVRGQFVDRIKLLASSSETSTGEGIPTISSLQREIQYVDEIEKCAQSSVSDPYPHASAQPLSEAVWRTMIGDRTYSERPAPLRYQKVLSDTFEFLHLMTKNVLQHGTEFIFEKPSVEMQEEFQMNNPSAADTFQETINDFSSADLLFSNPSGQRRFGVTERGYIGMVPNKSRVGDIVCVLFGMDTPFVLRECGTKDYREEQESPYQLVGESYVHGMMDGEAFDLGFEEVDFTLI